MILDTLWQERQNGADGADLCLVEKKDNFREYIIREHNKKGLYFEKWISA